VIEYGTPTAANGCFAELAYAMLVVTSLPTLPQAFAIALALGLVAMGYVRVRRRSRAG